MVPTVELEGVGRSACRYCFLGAPGAPRTTRGRGSVLHHGCACLPGWHPGPGADEEES